MNTTTPETDARFANPPTNDEAYDFARKLERERDEARAGFARSQESFKNYVEQSAIEKADLHRELTQLRASLHSAEQAATDNADWFDALVRDAAIELGCEPKPSAILDAIKKLRAWKKEMLLLESSWNEQKVGELIGASPGCSIRPKIQPAIEQLSAVCDELALDVSGETAHEGASLLAYHSLPHVKAKGKQ